MREPVFVPVAVESTNVAPVALTVEDTASGLRVTGLNGETAAELIRRMR